MADVLYIHYVAKQQGGPLKTVRRSVSQGKVSAVICEGGEWVVACQPKRAYLSQTNKKRFARHGPDFVATGDPRMVSCPRCLESWYYLRDTEAPASGPAVSPQFVVGEGR